MSAISRRNQLRFFAGAQRRTRQGCLATVGPLGVVTLVLLARAEPDVVTEVLSSARDTAGVISALARKNAITPVITQGALNEVLERKLIYDAGTTSGGSGGPVFGPDGTVIAVNFAMMRDFQASNFGVPIHFAQSLIR